MPKPTFFNLPEEKRRVILEVAIDEFAEREYSEVSISRIVERAGIAKGSFYQYFEDKKDLFLHLIDLMLQQKLEMLRANPPPDPKMGLFPYLQYQLRVGLEFNFSRPKLNRVAYRAYYGAAPFKDESLQRMKDAAAAYYLELIDLGIAQGDIDPGIDREAAAFVLGAAINDFGTYFMRKVGFDPNIIVERQLTEAEKQALHAVLSDVITVLRQGLGRRDQER